MGVASGQICRSIAPCVRTKFLVSAHRLGQQYHEKEMSCLLLKCVQQALFVGQITPVPSIYSIVPPNDGSALRHGHHFEPVDFVIDHGVGPAFPAATSMSRKA